jgi:hypothetical protein
MLTVQRALFRLGHNVHDLIAARIPHALAEAHLSFALADHSTA